MLRWILLVNAREQIIFGHQISLYQATAHSHQPPYTVGSGELKF